MTVLFRDVMIGSIVRTQRGVLLGKTSNKHGKANAVRETGEEVILPLEATVEVRHSSLKLMAAMLKEEAKRRHEQEAAALDSARQRARQLTQGAA